MLDISGKYNRDYNIRVIDKAFFSENVENVFKSKSIDEYMRQGEYEEYNISDAIVNGVITNEDIMTDEEQANHSFSDEEKNNIASAVGEVLKEYDLADKVDVVGSEPEENEEETEEETKEETKEESKEETKEETVEETTVKNNDETVNQAYKQASLPDSPPQALSWLRASLFWHSCRKLRNSDVGRQILY